MKITVTPTTGAFLVNETRQAAWAVPADIAWTDEGITGTMTLVGQQGKIVAHRLSVDGPPDFDAVAYVRTELKNVIKQALPHIQIPVTVTDHGIQVHPDPLNIGASSPRRWTRLTPDFLAEVAKVYQRAVTDGRPPVVAVMDEWQASRNTVNDWLRAARRDGWLPPTERAR